MEPVTVGLVSIPFLLLLLALRVHVGVALGLTGFLGTWLLTGRSTTALATLTTTPYTATAQFALAVVPLFILMGAWLDQAGFAEGAYRAAERWVGRVPGGLALSTIAGSALWGAASGSSAATCAVFTKFSLPQMLRAGYRKDFAAACISVTGVIDFLIPPSVLMIIYGILTGVSIGDLFLAGILPGILMAILFALAIYIQARLDPSSIGTDRGGGTTITWTERIAALKDTWGVVLLAVLVLGGIYAGIFTPTEAGAAGAWGTLILLILMRQFTWKRFWRSLQDAGEVIGMVFLILIGATVYARFLALSRLPATVVDWVSSSGLPPLLFILALIAIYSVLGCLLDSISIMTITLPIVYPISTALGMDPMWFAIISLLAIELGLITPPVAVNVYVVEAASGGTVSAGEIFRGLGWFYAAILVGLALIVAIPPLTTWLPGAQ